MIEVNLHPAGAKAAARRRGRLSFVLRARFRGGLVGREPWGLAAVAVPVLVVLSLALLWVLQRADVRDVEARLASATADSARLSDLRLLSDSLLERERLIRERVDLVSRLDGDRFVWPHMIDEISRALPEFTWLTAIKRESPLPDLQVQIQGVAASPLAITAFVRGLGESPYIGEVSIMGSQQQIVRDLVAQAFTLVVSYTEPPPALVRTEPLRVEEF
ncbi:MAG: PilN domain-containing protein [Gemmatimonadota bacterium]